MTKKKEMKKKKAPWKHNSHARKKTPPPPPPPPPPPTPQIQPSGTMMKKKIPEEVVSVLFVPRTPHSELAKLIRRDKHTISKLSGYRIKIIERCGSKLVDLLRNKGPDYAQPCGREQCNPCKQVGQPRGRVPCGDRSVLNRAF